MELQEVKDLSGIAERTQIEIYSYLAHEFPFVLILNRPSKDYFDKDYRREENYGGVPVHIDTGPSYGGVQGPKIFGFKTEEGMKTYADSLRAGDRADEGLQFQFAKIGKQIIPVRFNEDEKTELKATVAALFNAAGRPISDEVAGTFIRLAIDTLASANRRPDYTDPRALKTTPYITDSSLDVHRERVTEQRVLAAIQLQLRGPSF